MPIHRALHHHSLPSAAAQGYRSGMDVEMRYLHTVGKCYWVVVVIPLTKRCGHRSILDMVDGWMEGKEGGMR